LNPGTFDVPGQIALGAARAKSGLGNEDLALIQSLYNEAQKS